MEILIGTQVDLVLTDHLRFAEVGKFDMNPTSFGVTDHNSLEYWENDFWTHPVILSDEGLSDTIFFLSLTFQGVNTGLSELKYRHSNSVGLPCEARLSIGNTPPPCQEDR